MNRGNSKKEQKIIREADKLISMKENIDALSWSRVQEIADELRGAAISDERRDELARELISISQANISLSAKLGIISEAPAALDQQPSPLTQATSNYVSPKWKSEDAPHPEDSEFFHAQQSDDSAQSADAPAGEEPLIIPRANVSSTAEAVVDMPVKAGPTIEEVLADSSAATTHPMAPVPDENPVTSDPLINNAAADQLASGIDKMVDDLENRYKQHQQEKEEKQTQDEAESNSNDAQKQPEGEKPVQAAVDAPKQDEQNKKEESSQKDEEKKKAKKKKRKEEKKARKAQKAERKAQKEAAAKAAQQKAEELEKKIVQGENDADDNNASSEQVAAAGTEEVGIGNGSSGVPAGSDGEASSESHGESAEAVPDPTATKDPEVTKVSGFSTFKNVYNSRDARMSLYQDEDGHLVAVDATKLV